MIFIASCAVSIAQSDATMSLELHGRGMYYAVVVASVCISSTTSVWNSHLVRQYNSASLRAVNMLLYAFSFLCCAIAPFVFVLPGWDHYSPAFWVGHNVSTLSLVGVNVLFGVAVVNVYYYVGVVAKAMAGLVATALLLSVSRALTVEVGLSLAIVVAAVLSYYRNEEPASAVAEHHQVAAWSVRHLLLLVPAFAIILLLLT